MSSTYQINIGPYIVATIKTGIREIDYCVDHNRTSDHIHCPDCGRKSRFEKEVFPIFKKGWSFEAKIGGHTLSDRLYDASIWSNANYYQKDGIWYRDYVFLSNRNYPELEVMHIQGDFCVESLDDKNIEQIKKKFSEIFSEEIKYLKENFDNVQLFYGCVAYYA